MRELDGGAVSAVPTRPVLRYHGGKWLLAPWIVSHFPAHRVYVEPFGGAASVLMRKGRTYAEVYNDLDGEVVNLFRVLRDRESAGRLRELVALTPFSRDEFVAAYEPSGDPVEMARRTVVKSFMGFGSAAVTQLSPTKPGAGFKANTGFRSNSNRSGTTPAHDWRNLPECMKAVTERLQGVVIENRDGIEVMRTHDSRETLHYVDPPYVHSTRALKQWRTPQSYKHEMSDDDHERLAFALHGLAGKVVLSGYDCELYQGLYKDWRRVERPSHADGARDRVESLWMNFDAGLLGTVGPGEGG